MRRRRWRFRSSEGSSSTPPDYSDGSGQVGDGDARPPTMGGERTKTLRGTSDQYGGISSQVVQVNPADSGSCGAGS
eukprot:5715800-Pyramimonas_sp.AAC.1